MKNINTAPSEKETEFVREALAEFNNAHVGADGHTPLNIVEYGEEGSIIGGILGGTYWGWMYIDILWVHEKYRKCGIGSYLLAKAEEEALRRGCHHVHVDTMSWQAPDFYKKHGYEVIGVLPDIPSGNKKYLLMKTLRKVTVLPYDKKWKSDFEAIKKEIESAAGDLIIGIEHVGSTSVEGMSAKPCIDIDVIIKDYSVFCDVVKRLEKIGYIHEGNLGIPEREAFCYSGKEHLQKHHLYVCPKCSKELYRHITFRDFLRKNPDAAEKYSIVKQEAAKLFPNDTDKYIEYKTPCIKELYRMCGLE